MPSSDVKNVFFSCLDWLHNIGASVTEKREPVYIRAFHFKFADSRWGIIKFPQFGDFGPNPSYRVVDMEKIIKIRIKQMKDDVRLEICLDPYSKIPLVDRYENRKQQWMKFVGDLVQYLKVHLEKEEMRRYYTTLYFRDEKKRYILSLIKNLIIWIAFYYLFISSKKTTFTNITFLMMSFNTLYAFYYDYNKYKEINAEYNNFYN